MRSVVRWQAGLLAVATGGTSLVESAIVGDIVAGGFGNTVGGIVTRAAKGDTKNEVFSGFRDIPKMRSPDSLEVASDIWREALSMYPMSQFDPISGTKHELLSTKFGWRRAIGPS